MSHIWMSHVTHMNESCHTYEWVMKHIKMSHVTHIDESCDTYVWITMAKYATVAIAGEQKWMSHVPRIFEAWRTYEWVTAHVWMSHGIHMNESCRTYAQLLSTPPKNALIALFSSEVRQTCSKTPWNVPASTNYDVRLYKVHLSLYIKTFPEHFFEPIYHLDRVD